MKKSFKLTQRPGQSSTLPASVLEPTSDAAPEVQEQLSILESEAQISPPLQTSIVTELRPSRTTEPPRFSPKASLTTRKTIEVPEDYFFRVKMHALHRRIKEKDIWAEILEDYFSRHPDPK